MNYVCVSMLAQKDQCYHHDFRQQLFFHHNVVSFSLTLPSRFPQMSFYPNGAIYVFSQRPRADSIPHSTHKSHSASDCSNLPKGLNGSPQWKAEAPNSQERLGTLQQRGQTCFYTSSLQGSRCAFLWGPNGSGPQDTEKRGQTASSYAEAPRQAAVTLTGHSSTWVGCTDNKATIYENTNCVPCVQCH